MSSKNIVLTSVFVHEFLGERGPRADQQLPVRSCQRGGVPGLQPLLRCPEPAPWKTGGHVKGSVWRQTLSSHLRPRGKVKLRAHHSQYTNAKYRAHVKYLQYSDFHVPFPCCLLIISPHFVRLYPSILLSVISVCAYPVKSKTTQL